MITATFIFRQVATDADFERLDAAIAETASSSEGYLGRRAWMDHSDNRAVVYYWRTREDLERFRKDATHRLAKSRYKEWYAGYRVEIAEVIEARGDGYFQDWPE